MHNPLLEQEFLPKFSLIRAEHVESAVDTVLAQNRLQFAEVLKNPLPTWNALIEPLEEMDERLSQMWSVVEHLNSVQNSPELRAAYHACLPKITQYESEIGQNETLYTVLLQLQDSPTYSELSQAQKKVIDNALRDFKLSGVALSCDDKKRFQQLRESLSTACNRFSENVLDATEKWSLPITDKTMLAGLPLHVLSVIEEQNNVLTLDQPTYLAVMSYAHHRGLREQVYRAHVTRASNLSQQPQFDNAAILVEILQLRHEMAQLLGYTHFAALSLATKMAKTSEEVTGFLLDLTHKAKAQSLLELQILKTFAKEKLGYSELHSWDLAYVTEQLRQTRYQLSQEELRPYFPIQRVLSGMFKLAQTLYGVRIEESHTADVWNPDVRFFEVYDGQHGLCAAFYLDLYARPRKRDGAWMDECRVRRRFLNGSIQNPVAYITCNFARGTADQALLTHEEVTTLFHEFGHALHHMLTRVEYSSISGINGVPWDAVELPSQLMENWCWESEIIQWISAHYQTGESLPDEKIKALQEAKRFLAAMQMLRQVEFALFDMRLHSLTTPPQTPDQVQRVLDEVRHEVAIVFPPEFNRFQNTFTHIFSGGYGAGYYSYKWAEVLASDVYAQFEEQGILNPQVGNAFKELFLATGGVRDPMDLFVEFRGRKPSVEPLLKQHGIASAVIKD